MPDQPDGAQRAHLPAALQAPVGRLTRAEAERVIARAVELQDQAVPGEGLTLDDIEDVAAQIGVERGLVGRALADVRMAAAVDVEPSWTERLLGPRHVVGSTVVPLAAADVQAGTQAWMARDEGMRPIGTRHGGQRYGRDRRLIVGVQRGLNVPRASGVLRDLTAVTVTVDPQPGSSLVVVDADTTKVRSATTAISVLGLVGGIAVGIGAAGAVPDQAAISSDLAQFALASAGTAVASLSLAASVAQRWTARVRLAVEAALDGITLVADDPHAQLPAPTTDGWRHRLVRLLDSPGGRG